MISDDMTFANVNAIKLREIVSSGKKISALGFSDDFNDSIEILRGNEHINTLIFGYSFNQPIDVISTLINIKVLRFGDSFNQPIKSLESLKLLEILTFGREFNQPLVSFTQIKQITKLIFGDDFNQSIEPLKNLEYIKELTFGNNFDQSIESLPNIGWLTFGNNFNHPINSLSEKEKLIQVKFGDEFNQPVNNLLNNKHLLFLTIGNRFDQPIDLSKNNTLKTLTIGNSFNQSIISFRNNRSLYELAFGNNFNQSLGPLKKMNIKWITIGRYFNHSLDVLNDIGTMQELRIINYDQYSLKNLLEPLRDNNDIVVYISVLKMKAQEIFLFYKDCDILHLAIEENSKDQLEQLILDGFPVPNSFHQDSMVNLLRCYENHSNPDVTEFLKSFSKVIDKTDITDVEKDIVNVWIYGTYLTIQESIDKYHSKNILSDERISMTTFERTPSVPSITFSEFYNGLRNLCLFKPFPRKTYLYRGVGDIILNEPHIGDKFVFRRFTATSLVYEISMGFSEGGQMFLLEVDENTPGFNLLPFKTSESEILLPDGTTWEIIDLISNIYGKEVSASDTMIYAKFMGLLNHEEMLRIPL